MNYYLLTAGKMMVFLNFVIMCIRLLFLFLKKRKKYMWIELMNALKPGRVVKKGWIVVFTLLFLFFSTIVAAESNQQSASLNIALTYKEASNGLNPNGSRYNMSDILSDEVLENAINYGGFSGITVAELENALDIEPAGSDKDLNELVSTQFILKFKNNKNVGNLSGKEVVHSVAYAYRDWFINKYTANYSILDIPFDDIKTYDYPELESYLSNAIQIICNYSNSYYEKDPAFLSKKTGESFFSINSKAWDINNTGLESLSSYILSNGLSTDRKAYMSRLRYEYTHNTNNYKRDISAYHVRLNAISKYDNDMATVVYIPTYDTDNTFYMSKTKIGIDHFSADADSFSSNAADTLSMMLKERYWLERLQESTATSDTYLKAEGMIESLRKQILDLAELTKSTVQDYIDTSSNGYVSIAEPVEAPKTQYILGLTLGLLFFCITYVGEAMRQLGHDMSKRKDKKK